MKKLVLLSHFVRFPFLADQFLKFKWRTSLPLAIENPMDDKATTDTYIQGGGGGRPPSLFLDQTPAQRVKKTFFGDRSPPRLSKGLDDRGPPISQVLDPALHFVAFNVSSLRNTILSLLLGFAQMCSFFRLISYADHLSASLTRDLGTRLFSHVFFVFIYI